MQKARLLAYGIVQGVGFREFVCRVGKSLSLSGYAKNLPDGTVEIVAEGEENKIDELVRRISVRMPSGISVHKLLVIEKKEIQKKGFASFSVAY